MSFNHGIMSHVKKKKKKAVYPCPVVSTCTISHFDQNKGDFVPM